MSEEETPGLYEHEPRSSISNADDNTPYLNLDTVRLSQKETDWLCVFVCVCNIPPDWLHISLQDVAPNENNHQQNRRNMTV